MTDNEQQQFNDLRNAYIHQILNSEGFFVNESVVPRDYFGPPIHPYPFEKDDDCNNFCKLAIDKYNRKLKDPSRKLEFVEVVNATEECSTGFYYRLTFEASEKLDEGQKKISVYQAIVRTGFKNGKHTTEALAFRPEPDLHSTPDLNKAWFWHNFRGPRVRPGEGYYGHLFCRKSKKAEILIDPEKPSPKIKPGEDVHVPQSTGKRCVEDEAHIDSKRRKEESNGSFSKPQQAP